MKISKSEFTISVAHPQDIVQDELPQIAFVGRSNVGKSSLINCLTGNGKLARTSSTPGRTRLINYFLINNSFYFVDLPGYGFAKASKMEITSWQSMIEPYINNNSKLQLVCLLVDSKVGATEDDKQMMKYLSYFRVPYVVVATKVDKFGKSKIKPRLSEIALDLGFGPQDVFGVSAVSKYGREQLLEKMDQFIVQ